LVWSILVCFESVFIRVALVQSDFVMRVYIPSRSVVSTVQVCMTTPELCTISNRSTISPPEELLSLSVGAKSSTIWLVFGKRHMGGTVHPALKCSGHEARVD
jgi:hypothetical protein